MSLTLHPKQHEWRGILSVIFLLFVFNCIASVIHISLFFIRTYDTIVSSPNEVGEHDIAIVFGAGLDGDTAPSAMLADRLETAVDLYDTKKVRQILVTGDDGFRRKDEVSVMRNYLIEQGVPSEDVLLDHHGYRTYESCYRVAHVFGIHDAIVISQRFHLSRILYLCESQGVSVVGLDATRRVYDDLWTPYLREVLARVKAVWQTEVTRPLPTNVQ